MRERAKSANAAELPLCNDFTSIVRHLTAKPRLSHNQHVPEANAMIRAR